MNENLDLTKILDGCPEGTEFYSPVYGEVKFVKIDTSLVRPIITSDIIKDSFYPFTAKGRVFFDIGECMLFPSKDQRDWAKFERFWDKPKVEKFDPKTLHPFDKVLVRNSTEIWQPNFFGYINDENPKTISCFGFYWDYCIPYNEETKHLAGKKEDCPEYYKWWEE